MKFGFSNQRIAINYKLSKGLLPEIGYTISLSLTFWIQQNSPRNH